MTEEERKLWYDFLSLLPLTAHRQKPIGPYIVDFYIPAKKIVIELDGIQHYYPEQKAYDKERDDHMKNKGITVIRFNNSAINDNFVTVQKKILQHLGLDDRETFAYIEKKRAEKLEYRKRRNKRDR